MSDLISKSALLEKEWCTEAVDGYPIRVVEVGDILDAPTVEAKPVVHGSWMSYLDGDHIMPDVYYKCNKCGSRGHEIKWHYCPSCGAKMDL